MIETTHQLWAYRCIVNVNYGFWGTELCRHGILYNLWFMEFIGCYIHKEEKPTKLWLDEDGLVRCLAFSVWKGTRTKQNTV